MPMCSHDIQVIVGFEILQFSGVWWFQLWLFCPLLCLLFMCNFSEGTGNAFCEKLYIINNHLSKVTEKKGSGKRTQLSAVALKVTKMPRKLC